jgi:hypothetical protein
MKSLVKVTGILALAGAAFFATNAGSALADPLPELPSLCEMIDCSQLQPLDPTPIPVNPGLDLPDICEMIDCSQLEPLDPTPDPVDPGLDLPDICEIIDCGHIEPLDPCVITDTCDSDDSDDPSADPTPSVDPTASSTDPAVAPTESPTVTPAGDTVAAVTGDQSGGSDGAVQGLVQAPNAHAAGLSVATDESHDTGFVKTVAIFAAGLSGLVAVMVVLFFATRREDETQD